MQSGESDPGKLSVQQITDCMRRGDLCANGMNNCCGGDVIDTLDWIKEQGGLPTQAAYGDADWSSANPNTSCPCKTVEQNSKIVAMGEVCCSDATYSTFIVDSWIDGPR